MIDVQPAYEHYCNKIAGPLCNFLNGQNKPINIMFNGKSSGLTEDDESDVRVYFMEHGLNTDVMDNAKYIDKEYGFFRSWMDVGIPDRLIILTIRKMFQQRVSTSEEVEFSEEEIKELDNAYYDWQSDPIYFPDFITINELRQLSPFYMAGGGRDACLREIELICNAFNIPFKRMNDFIY